MANRCCHNLQWSWCNCTILFSLFLILTFQIDLNVNCTEETEIVLDDESITNRTNTFYTIDSSTNSTDNNLTVLDNNNETTVDDFWDFTTPTPSSTANTSTNGPAVVLITSTYLPPMPMAPTWSTLPPPFTNIRRTSPFSFTTTTNSGSTNSIFSYKENDNETTTTSSIIESINDNNNNSNNNNNNIIIINNENSINENNRIWKVILHGTNMNSEELRMCNKTLLENHFKRSSRRKVARNMKRELERIFAKYNYKFSILVSSTSRNSMGKALHGVWMSISINADHYFITATHGIVDGPKIKEEQMEKIEYWAHVHAIGSRNMTGYRKYNRIATKLKQDLDRYYGNGNVWSVVIVKNPLLVKAKVFEDPEYHVEFNRLNGGHFIVFRGGKNIDTGSRHAKELLIPESDDNTLETETEHEDYLNNIYLLTWAMD